ncbi:MAG: CaiB/BaiF CoA-transferase family protein [Ardenticatenaceae bacterium]|nr:CaiB/BaiF CoA-transferase family protein [Ardenticatenaceae bacterium]
MSAPLESLKILDFSTLLPGPYATMILADLGADILRVEAPDRPDMVRLVPPFGSDGQSAQHALLNRSKRSLGLNLKAAGAADIVKKLITEQGYDIVVEQFRPGVMTRLGVGYEALKECNPRLIFCSLTGYGQSGPYQQRAGHDLNYLALAGILSAYGRRGETPPPMPLQVADVGAGSLHLVIGLLAAVIRRQVTGQGDRVDISMHDGSLALNSINAAGTLVGKENPQPEGTMLNGGTFYDLYETKDGRLLSVGSLEPKFWRGFCQAIGREDLFPKGINFDVAHQQSFKEEIKTALLTKTLNEWEEIFARLDVCVEPVLTTREALDHPQTLARDMIVDVPQSDGTIQPQIGTPIKLSSHQPSYPHTGVSLGSHTKEILVQLGYSETEIENLYEEKVVQ